VINNNLDVKFWPNSIVLSLFHGLDIHIVYTIHFLLCSEGMVRTVYVALVGKEPDFDFMSANTVTMWREVVARHRIASCVDLMRGKPYFLMGDGSERKGKSLFGLYIVGFDQIQWKHFTVHHNIDLL
jgi:hypothetical protein